MSKVLALEHWRHTWIIRPDKDKQLGDPYMSSVFCKVEYWIRHYAWKLVKFQLTGASQNLKLNLKSLPRSKHLRILWGWENSTTISPDHRWKYKACWHWIVEEQWGTPMINGQMGAIPGSSNIKLEISEAKYLVACCLGVWMRMLLNMSWNALA